MCQMLFGSESINRYNSLKMILDDGECCVHGRAIRTDSEAEDAPHKTTLEVLHGLMHRHHKRRITAKQGAIMLTRQEIDSSGSVSVFSGTCSVARRFCGC